MLDTGNRPISEHTGRDSFWGNGGDGSGLNIIGRLLMELRKKLRTSTNEITTVTFYDSELPFRKSNWVLKNLIVGDYPGDMDLERHHQRSLALVKIGVTDIISLIPTVESNKLRSYEETMWIYNDKIKFTSFPIKDRSTTNDKETRKFVESLMNFLSDEKKIIYLHCKGGHGRTGLIISILIGLMFKIPADDALNYCQALHFRRLKLKPIKHHRCISPQTKEQYNQVRRILKTRLSKY